MKLVLIFLGLLPAVLSAGNVISVKSNDLGYYLCGDGKDKLAPDTTLELSTNFVHRLNFSQQQFCILEDLVNLTIISNSSSHHQAVIQCDPSVTGGIGFINASRLQLLDLNFLHCGGVIPDSALRHVNDSKSSPFYIIPNQQAVLIFSHCRDLVISNVIVTRFNGFGILGINLYGLHTTISKFSASRNNRTSSNGAMFYFFDSNLTNSSTIARVHLTGLEFHSIINILPDHYDLSKLFLGQRESILPLVGSAGVSFVFAQSYKVAVIFNRSLSYFNIGSVSGGAFVLFLNNFQNSTLCIHSFTVNENFPVGTSGSSGLLVQFARLNPYLSTDEGLESWEPLKIVDSIFFLNSPPSKTYSSTVLRNGAISIMQYWPVKNASIILSQIKFYNNTSNLPGSCGCFCANYIYTVGEYPGQSISNGISLYLEDTVAMYNGGGYPTSSTAMFSFKGFEKVTFSGNSTFAYNYGSVIKARLTAVYLQDKIVFENNRGLQGPVFQISELAYLVIAKPLNATFISNAAFYYGGVLYSDTTGDDDSPCVLQVRPAVSNSSVNVSFNFINNSAIKSGNTIYAHPFYNCTQYTGYADVLSLYKKLFTFSENSTQVLNGAVLNQISSKATKLCRCDINGTASAQCDQSVLPAIRIYGGERVNYSVCSVDAVGSIVYSSVIVRLYKTQTGDVLEETSSVSIPPSDQARQLYENTCTVSNVTILRHNGQDKEENITVTISLLQQQPSYRFNVTVMPCPIGFTLNSGYCRCSDFFTSLSGDIVCDVNDQTISGLSKVAWLGMINSTTLGFSRVCPFESCHSDLTMVDLSHPGDICKRNRTGVLCGSCKGNLSVMLGTHNCSACSNYYLFLLVLFAMAGVVLVVLLMVLRITVSSGTIGGLVFYANISGTSTLHFLDHDYLFLRVIISLLNLNLGFPLCLFDGMTTLHKSFLHYAFPAYLMLLLLMITLISHWSATFSKLLVHNITVQVFATLIFLSYSNLLQASLLALISVQVQYTDSHHYKTVWFLDGSVDYFSFTDGHAYLAILAILTLLFIVLPYTVLATISGKMLRYRWFALRFKPLVDAHYAPYKDKWHFWYGVRLWVLLYAISVYAFTRGLQTRGIVVYMLELLVLIPFLCIQAYIRPYKNNLLNLLDLFLMTILTMTTAGLTYDDNSLVQKIAPVVSSIVVILVLMVVFVYHIYARCGSRKCLCCNILRDNEQQRLLIPTQSAVTISSDTYESIEEIRKNESQRNKLRESLLGFVDGY